MEEVFVDRTEIPFRLSAVNTKKAKDDIVRLAAAVPNSMSVVPEEKRYR
jgi:hypothetical protein